MGGGWLGACYGSRQKGLFRSTSIYYIRFAFIYNTLKTIINLYFD